MAENLVEKLPNRLEKALNDLISPNEEVLLKLQGAFKEGIVCTDKRVLILKAGMMSGQMFGSDAFQQPYSNITGVQVKFNLMSGYFEMSAGGMQNTSKSYWSTNKNSDPAKAPNCVALNSRKQAKKFQSACTFILQKIDESKSSHSIPIGNSATREEKEDVYSSLEKLGKLRDSGILTEEEFQTKKADLLAKI